MTLAFKHRDAPLLVQRHELGVGCRPPLLIILEVSAASLWVDLFTIRFHTEPNNLSLGDWLWSTPPNLLAPIMAMTVVWLTICFTLLEDQLKLNIASISLLSQSWSSYQQDFYLYRSSPKSSSLPLQVIVWNGIGVEWALSWHEIQRFPG